MFERRACEREKGFSAEDALAMVLAAEREYFERSPTPDGSNELEWAPPTPDGSNELEWAPPTPNGSN
ncbi:hypothetical protein DL765_010450 [Monosporascus sp. GIB2]|nr:hypothetical protein DL765_010450 [Monosporascus sp. GIB2]